MQHDGLQPNKFIFSSLIKACGSMGDLEGSKRLHAAAAKYRCESDLIVRTCMIDIYGKCGSLADAQNVFDGSTTRNVVAWTAIISAYTQQGQEERALQL